MLTTGAMIRLGKTYGNLMVDLRATNSKLTARSRRIVSELTGLDAEAAERLLAEADGDVNTAVVAHLRRVSPDDSRQILAQVDGHLRKALDGQEPVVP